MSKQAFKQIFSELEEPISPERPEKVLVEDIRALGSDEKKKLLADAGITHIDAKTGIAMKAALWMPWNQFRTL